MQSIMRLVCLIYLVLLTALLLTSDPLRWTGMAREPWLVRTLLPAAHLLSFGGLAFFALAASWPAPRWAGLVFLVIYAALTEITQRLLPWRQAQWNDWFQDIAGIALGAVVCWGTTQALGALAKAWGAAPRRNRQEPASDWEVVKNVMSRPTVRGQSWWT